MLHCSFSVRWFLIAALAASVLVGPAATVSAAPNQPARTLAPSGTATPAPITVPTWSGSFASAGASYPYTMVGGDPAAGSLTLVPVQIVPLRFKYANGVVLDGSDRVRDLLASPLFAPAQFDSGFTQYGDAMLRANFWQTVSASSPRWHVLLAPEVLPTQTIDVPADRGREFVGPTRGEQIGQMDEAWLDPQLEQLLTTAHTDPRAFVVFLTHNSTPLLSGLCCDVGYHNVTQTTGPGGRTELRTWMFGSYIDDGTYGGVNNDSGAIFSSDFRDVNIIAHEVVEWLEDPFTDNPVPSYQVLTGDPSLYNQFFGCSTNLEVGDPIVGSSFAVRSITGQTYHLPDAANIAFFSRGPSTSLHNRYSYLGQLSGPSTPC